MFTKFFVFALFIIFLSGCATANKNYVLELQQCHGRIASLEAEVKDKGREVEQLERQLRRKESQGYGRNGPVKTHIGSADISNPSIIQIQKALKNAGYYNGSLDGKMGPKTQEAIIKFQKDNGLKADGKVGRMTWSELKSYLE